MSDAREGGELHFKARGFSPVTHSVILLRGPLFSDHHSMTIVLSILLALVLVLAPIYAAQPDAPAALASSEWASFLCTGTFLAALLGVVSARCTGPFALRFSGSEKAFLVLLGLAFLSIPLRLAAQHGTGYFGTMLRGWSVLAVDFALFAVARRAARNRIVLYGLLLAAVAGAAVAADIGVQEYVVHWRAGERNWRIFATSTPDFLAGYFVLMLPVTLALFLAAPGLRGLTPLLRGLVPVVLGVVLLLEVVALLTTGSRFGLVSLVVSLGVFGASLFAATRRGLVLPSAARLLLGALGVIFVGSGAVFAGPVLVRLHNLQDNSAAFRVWTWRGSVQMALHNPVLGTGIGTWTDLYPKYALTGFTRLAHNSYLQMADECGIFALLALLAILGLLGLAVTRGLRQMPDTAGDEFLPADNRLLLCGLAGSLAGGVVQNLIDSDWYVFFLGAIFWTLAGLAAGAIERQEAAAEKPLSGPNLAALGTVAAALLALTGTQSIGAGYAMTAVDQKDADPGGAVQSYTSARAWDPLNGRYPSDQGYAVQYSRLGDLAGAETALNTSIALEPNSVNYRRLGTVLQAAGRNADAVAAYKNGLRAEPHSVELLLRLARTSPPGESLGYYQILSALEISPVGTARALGESVEPSFAYADAALGDALGQAADYARAASLLETYIGQGGSVNSQREALTGGHPDPQIDTALRALYQHTLTRLIALSPAQERAALKSRAKEFDEKFDRVIQEASKDALKSGIL